MRPLHDEDNIGPREKLRTHRNLCLVLQAGRRSLDTGPRREDMLGRWAPQLVLAADEQDSLHPSCAATLDLAGAKSRRAREQSNAIQRRVKRPRAERASGNTMACPRGPLERIVSQRRRRPPSQGRPYEALHLRMHPLVWEHTARFALEGTRTCLIR
jgi:hypothetical protein